MQSRNVVPITECPVHEPRANHIAFALHDHLSRAQVSAAGPTLRGVLRHLIIRTTRDGREAVAMLVVTRNDKSLRAPIRAFLATADAPDGFYLNIHDRPGPYMVGRETMRLAGRSHVRERVAGMSFLVSPTAFFQTNIEAAEAIVQIVLETAGSLAPGANVLDLYAGGGLFALPLAARGHVVTAVEENAHAIRDADANVRLNKLSGGTVRLHAARVEDALHTLRRDPVDLVVLDSTARRMPAAPCSITSSAASAHRSSSTSRAIRKRSPTNSRPFASTATRSRECGRSICFRTPRTSRVWWSFAGCRKCLGCLGRLEC